MQMSTYMSTGPIKTLDVNTFKQTEILELDLIKLNLETIRLYSLDYIFFILGLFSVTRQGITPQTRQEFSVKIENMNYFNTEFIHYLIWIAV